MCSMRLLRKKKPQKITKQKSRSPTGFYAVTQGNVDCLRISLGRASPIRIEQHLNIDPENMYSYANIFFIFYQNFGFYSRAWNISEQFDNCKIVNKSLPLITLRKFYFVLFVRSCLKTTFLTDICKLSIIYNW